MCVCVSVSVCVCVCVFCKGVHKDLAHQLGSLHWAVDESCNNRSVEDYGQGDATEVLVHRLLNQVFKRVLVGVCDTHVYMHIYMCMYVPRGLVLHG